MSSGTWGLSKMGNKYQLIYADPPWLWSARSAKGEGRSPKNHYSVMTSSDIAALPVRDLVERDSVCLMWVVDPMIETGYAVMRSWGFFPVTVGFYWVKTNRNSPGYFTGLGYYTRANPEQCILGVGGRLAGDRWIKGRGLKVLAHDVPRLIVSPRGKHSEKPVEAYERIERLFGDVSRLELFARSRRPGWDAFGNQVDGSISLPETGSRDTVTARDIQQERASEAT